MKKSSYIGMFRTVASVIVALVSALVVSSCNGMIYDDQGDCSAKYRLMFRYDYNMKFADAFAHEVKSVAVYAFDVDGNMVWHGTDRGERLAADGYALDLPLPAGDYRIVAWCGLDDGESFTVGVRSRSDLTDMVCTLNTEAGAGGTAYCDDDLHPLFYGSIDVTLPTMEDGGEYTCTVPLVKDTNVFRIVLQQMSGDGLDSNDFEFSIEGAGNARLDSENGLMEGGDVTYGAWSKYSDEAGCAGDARLERRPQPPRADSEKEGRQQGAVDTGDRLCTACERQIQQGDEQSGVSRPPGRVQHDVLPRCRPQVAERVCDNQFVESSAR